MLFYIEQSGRGAGAQRPRLEQKNTLFEVPCSETSFKKLFLVNLTFGRKVKLSSEMTLTSAGDRRVELPFVIFLSCVPGSFRYFS